MGIKKKIGDWLTRKAEEAIEANSHHVTECTYCGEPVKQSEAVIPVYGYCFCDFVCLKLYRSQV